MSGKSRFAREYEKPRSFAEMLGFTVALLSCCAMYAWIMVVELPRAIDAEFPAVGATSDISVAKGGNP